MTTPMKQSASPIPASSRSSTPRVVTSEAQTRWIASTTSSIDSTSGIDS